MKLITAIVNRRDTSEVCAALTDAGFYFTRMASTGGFLTGGNSTLLIGTEEDRVPQAIAIIRQNCSRRTEKISSNVQLATPSAAYPTEVTVGGATLFVSDVTQFEKDLSRRHIRRPGTSRTKRSPSVCALRGDRFLHQIDQAGANAAPGDAATVPSSRTATYSIISPLSLRSRSTRTPPSSSPRMQKRQWRAGLCKRAARTGWRRSSVSAAWGTRSAGPADGGTRSHSSGSCAHTRRMWRCPRPGAAPSPNTEPVLSGSRIATFHGRVPPCASWCAPITNMFPP